MTVELKAKPFRTAAEIKAALAKRYRVSVAEIDGRSTCRRVSTPRQMAMALCRRKLGYTLPQIARVFGNRNPSTVYFACRKFGYVPTPEASELGYRNGFGRGKG